MRFIAPGGPRHTTTHPEATIAKLKFTITMSLDGHVAGPRQNLGQDVAIGGGAETAQHYCTGLVSSAAAAHYTYAATRSENS